jgi:hypothetical protein
MAKRSARARVNALPVASVLGVRVLTSGVGGDEEQSDYRPVPASDKGNDGYGDRGMFGSYAPDNRDAFRDPPDVRHFTGYGATEADISRGYSAPGIREDPAYDAVNYRDRYTRPRAPDEDNNTDSAATTPDDWNFRGRNTRSRGFFTRPRIPTER